MPSAGSGAGGGRGNEPWEKRHTDLVVLGIIRTAYASRAAIYASPGLAGKVDGHGCDRLGKQLVIALKKIAVAHGLDAAVVEEVKREAGGGKRKATAMAAPSGCGGGGGRAGGVGKKRAKRDKKHADDDCEERRERLQSRISSQG